MDEIGKPERETQRRLIKPFREELGYKYLGDWNDREGNSNIDERIFGAWQCMARAWHRSFRPATNQEKREQVLEDWYREQVKQEIGLLIAKWRPVLKVKVESYYVQRMKTRWGSCNTDARTIRINSELAKKEPDCLEYIVVHEMVHLLERSHNDRFRRLMDKFYPKWSHVRTQLNQAPLSHTEWGY